MNHSIGDSIGGILAPKKENLRKYDSIKALAFFEPRVRKVTRSNLDPEVVPIIFDPQRILRKSKTFQVDHHPQKLSLYPKGLFTLLKISLLQNQKKNVFKMNFPIEDISME